MKKNKPTVSPINFKPKPIVLAVQHALPYLVALGLSAAVISPAVGRSGDSAAAFTATQLIRQFTLKNTVAQVSQGMQGYVAEFNGVLRASEMGTVVGGYPVDMGSVPSSVNLPQRDGAGRPLGYCAWDNSASTSNSSFLAGQGVANPLVYAVLKEALSLRASDIHLSRKGDPDAWIAYRVDSVMRQTHLLPELLMQSLVARIKIEAGMDASNSRTAQDGRLTVEHEGRVVDFRISTQPLVDGESVVLRALDASLLPSLGALFPGQPKMTELIKSITNQTGKTGGLVFISGATGSGKSTTQYTVACGFRRDAMNVITVEDPVEYILPFAKQIQLQALIKQKAIELERSILRQDPDILIFGEVRDADSARAALAFAESGHLVISTIHANSVLQVSERFLSMIDPAHRADSEFLLAHFLRVVIHQRLVRRLCSCAKPVQGEMLEHFQSQAVRLTGGLIQPRTGLRHKVGCTRCAGLGYSGRVAAHETMHVPAEETMRGRFVKAFKSHNLELPVDLCEENGVDYTSRLQTLQTLLDQGMVDWPSVLQILGVAGD